MIRLKGFIITLLLSSLILCLSVPVCAVQEIIDFAEWNQIEESYIITTDDTPSNSSLKNAVLKMTEDEASNRMTILFMLEFNTFTDTNNIDIMIRVNGDEEIIIHTDDAPEYNDDKYFVSNIIHTEEPSKIIYVQTVLGIKDGLPEKKTLSLQFRDCEGILSNRYNIEISDGAEELPSEEITQEQTTSKTSKTAKTKKSNKSDKTKKTAKTNKADKTGYYETQTATDMPSTENSVTVGYTENNDKESTVSTGKVVGGITGIIVLVLSAGYGLSHLIHSKQQKRGEG